MIRLLILAAAALLLQTQPALAQDGCAPDALCDVPCAEPTQDCRPAADLPPAGAAPGNASADGRADAPAEAPFVASRLGRVFYAVKCGAWRALARANLVWFSGAAEARAAGYEPSRSAGCAPPGATPRSPAPSAASAPDSASRCVLQRVVDGDTVLCRGGTRIRLLLIDTPEMDQGQYGRQARQYVVELVPRGTALRVSHDVVREDRYGRTLAYLFLPDGRMVNEEIARAGYAVVIVYPPNVRHVDRIRRAVERARSAGAGLWDTPAFECTPAEHRADRCVARPWVDSNPGDDPAPGTGKDPMLKRYDPESAPDPDAWLEAGDEERLRLISKAHRRLRVELPNERAHALFHLIVENQVAMREETPAAATLQRLMGEGLTRHDAIHAVGSVLAEHLNGLVGGAADPGEDPHAHYFRDLGRLTASSWREKYS